MYPIDLWKTDKPLFLQTAALFIFAAGLPFSVTLIQGGILLFLGTALFMRHQEDKLRGLPSEIRQTQLLSPWLGYFAVGLLSALAAGFPSYSVKVINSDLLKILAFLGLCLFMTPKQRNGAAGVYLFSANIFALVGIVQFLYALAHGTDPRAHGTLYPVRYGEVMAIGVLFAVSRLAADEPLKGWARKYLYASMLTLTSALFLSLTRGAYLGAAAGIIAIFAFHRKSLRMLPLFAAAAAIVFGLSLLNPTIRYKMVSTFEGAAGALRGGAATRDGSINIRFELWRIGGKMIKSSPILGIGPGGVKRHFTDYAAEPYPGGRTWSHLHNMYIHHAAERGLAGLAALMSLFIAMLFLAVRNFRAAPSHFTLWALAMIAGWFVMNLTEVTFRNSHPTFALIFALAASISARKASPALDK